MLYVNHTDFKVPLFFDSQSKYLLFAVIPKQGTPCVHILKLEQYHIPPNIDNVAKKLMHLLEQSEKLPTYNTMFYRCSIGSLDHAIFEAVEQVSVQDAERVYITLKGSNLSFSNTH